MFRQKNKTLLTQCKEGLCTLMGWNHRPKDYESHHQKRKDEFD